MSVTSVEGLVPNDYSYEANVGKRTPTKELDKNAFLQLFILSLKSQDPTNPQDSSEFMSQMAQFSILEQLSNMNSEISKLKQSQEIDQASGLIGREVKVFFAGVENQGTVERINIYKGEVTLFLKNNPLGYPLENVTEVK